MTITNANAEAARRIKKGYTLKPSRNGKTQLYVYDSSKYLSGTTWPYSYIGQFDDATEAATFGKAHVEVSFGLKPKGRPGAAYKAALKQVRSTSLNYF